MKLTRFINFVKGLIDRNPAMEHLSDIIDAPDLSCKPHDVHILKTLILDKRLTWYDSAKQDYADEPQDRDLVAHFFTRINGASIRGFRTMNKLTIDT